MTNRDNDTQCLIAWFDEITPASSPRQHSAGEPALPATAWHIRPQDRVVLVRLGKFLVVGGVGTLVNTFTLFVLVQWARWPLLIAAILAAEFAIVNNFYVNNRWTFGQARGTCRRFCQFHLVSLGGLVINILTLWLMVGRAALPYLAANLVGIALATVWNFAANALWTWGGVA